MNNPIQKHLNTIKEMMKNYDCPYNFECYKSNFQTLYEIIYISPNMYECFEEKAIEGECSELLGCNYYCKCSIRIYIYENL